MHSPFTVLNEDLMRQDRRAQRIGIAATLIAMAVLVLTVIALKYAHDLHQALQILFPVAGAE